MAIPPPGPGLLYSRAMNGTPPRVDALVINWNGREHLAACFDALLANSYPNARYILVDNASTDDSVAFVTSRYGGDPRVAVHRCPSNLGWSGGNNHAMRASLDSGADYLFLLNNDTAAAPDAIARLVAQAEAEPETGALAPRMLLFDQPWILNSRGLACSMIGASWDIGIGRVDRTAPEDPPEEVIGVCGGAMFLRARALRNAGLLPESFEIYLDDLDLCLRIWEAGHAVRTCPAAAVRHKFSATFGTGPRARHKYFLNTRNRFLIQMRNFPLSALPEAAAWTLLGEVRACGRTLLDREPWRVAAHARAWIAALGCLPAALRERRRRASQPGRRPHAFWPLVRRRPMFCPAVPLPEKGWYPARTVNGAPLSPMSQYAYAECGSARLRVTLVNCYPELGAAEVRLLRDGEEIARLVARGPDAAVTEVSPGPVEFAALRVFLAEDTGEAMDCGGWLRLEPLDQ